MSSHRVVFAKLYELVSRRGRRYFVGRLGAAKVLMIETGGADRGSPVWLLNLEEGAHTTKDEAALAPDVAADDGQERPDA